MFGFYSKGRSDAEAPKSPRLAYDDARNTKYAGLGQAARAYAAQQDGYTLSPYDECQAREHAAGMFDGKHFLEYGEEADQLKREGRLPEALALVMKIIDATEREQAEEARNAATYARLLGRSPNAYLPRETPPGWTKRAAIILRKMGDLEAEIAVIDRWERHAGDPSRWVGVTHSELLERREKARGLLAKRNQSHS